MGMVIRYKMVAVHTLPQLHFLGQLLVAWAPYTYNSFLDGRTGPCTSPTPYGPDKQNPQIMPLPPGPQQFSVQTTDQNGIQTVTSFRWTILVGSPSLSPAQATQQLIQLTNSMNLAPATDQTLDAQLNAAILFFQHNLNSGACGHLNGFATEVHVLLQVGRFTQTQTSELLHGVQSVENAAGC